MGEQTTGGLTEDQTERKDLIAAVKIGWDEAANTALATVQGAKLVDIELKRSTGGGPEWDSKIAAADGTAHEVEVDAVSGKVTRSRVESDQDAEDKRELAGRLSSAKITAQQAVTTATDRKKGTVSAVGLEDSDGGATIWSVDVVTANDWYKTAFDIDAANGDVLREEVDRD
ncbi:PepSY domain-containing protein [Streptomyces sp. NPDC002133]|uniref:PepSY domain-containing protein n=1 Tax=Streptomyces sp. NPDC002133 TaxID=3154409 RepID=UPI003320A1A7